MAQLFSLGSMTTYSQYSGWMPIVVFYIITGFIFGLVAYLKAFQAFKNHPRRDLISQPDLFMRCMLANGLIWPKFVVWYVFISLLKIFAYFGKRR